MAAMPELRCRPVRAVAAEHHAARLYTGQARNEMTWQRVLRPQPGQRAAAGGAGAGHHLRPDGRHQHGARRAADDRRLRHLPSCRRRSAPGCRAGSTGTWRRRCRWPSWSPRWSAWRWNAPSSAGSVAGRWKRAAGHLGHQPDADAGRAHAVRRAERGGGQPQLDVRRLHGAGRPGADLQPAGHHRLRPVRGVPGVGAAEPHPARPVRARHHPEPAHGRLRRRAHRPRRHAGLRPGLGHRRAGRRGAVAAGQRGPGPGPRLHRRFVHGGGAGRRRPAGRHRHRRAGPGRRQQIPGALRGSGHGQDHHPGAHRAYRQRRGRKACSPRAAGASNEADRR